MKEITVIPETVCYIRATYYVRDINNPVKLVNKLAGITEMWIEKEGQKANPIFLKPTWTFSFPETGEYKVCFRIETETILTRAFEDCTALREIEISEGVTKIGNGAFEYCTALKSVTIPNSVKSIGDDAFYGCTGLTSVVIPNSVTSIGDGAFQDCSGLTSVTISEGVTKIGVAVFENCTSLKEISIPEGVTTIGSEAFDGCTALKEITMPSTLTDIWSFAFAGCASLISVEIPEGVTYIGDLAIYRCKALEKITLPSTLESIGIGCFQDCILLASITCKATTAPEIGDDVFSIVKGGGVLTVPAGATGYDTWIEKVGARWKKEEYSRKPSFKGEEQGKDKNSRIRTIKFRGKAENGGEWFYGSLQIYQETHASKLCVCAASVRTWKEALLYAVDPDTVGQFTGLLDKNGKEIYEGDIICGCNSEIRHLIFYRENQARFMAALGGDVDDVGVCGLDDEGWRTSKEVIGNIYDNPDLLYEEEIIP